MLFSTRLYGIDYWGYDKDSTNGMRIMYCVLCFLHLAYSLDYRKVTAKDGKATNSEDVIKYHAYSINTCRKLRCLPYFVCLILNLNH